MFETHQENHIHLLSAGFVHRILHDMANFICVPHQQGSIQMGCEEERAGGGIIQVSVYYVSLVCKINLKLINHSNLLCIHVLF